MRWVQFFLIMWWQGHFSPHLYPTPFFCCQDANFHPKKSLTVEQWCFLGGECLHHKKNSITKCAKDSFGTFFCQSRHILRKKSQKLPNLDNKFLEVHRTKRDPKKFLLCWLTSTQNWLFLSYMNPSPPTWQIWKKEQAKPIGASISI